MKARGSRDGAQPFTEPQAHLDAVLGAATRALIATAADLAAVVGSDGVVRDVAVGADSLAGEGVEAWVGRRLIDTVTLESRVKIEELLRDAAGDAAPRWRQVNHPSPRGGDLPVRYLASKPNGADFVLVVGRELREAASLQQRLIRFQNQMERKFATLRQAETRYRLLFRLTSEAVLVVDAETRRIVEANPAAERLLAATAPAAAGARTPSADDAAARLIGAPFPEGFDDDGRRALEAMLAVVAATGADETAVASLADDATGDPDAAAASPRSPLHVSASLFRQEDRAYFLVRVALENAAAWGLERAPMAAALAALRAGPDGFVLTDADGRIQVANAAFLEMAQCAAEAQVRGLSLERFLGRPGVDLSVLMSSLKEHGAVRLFSTTLAGRHGVSNDVEISGVLAPGDGPHRFAFAIRSVGLRMPSMVGGGAAGGRLPRSVEQLAELVGRVPLRDLVRETTDVIERMCIEAALEITGDNRASAAEILGLSRQSFYVKLRRYGLGDLGSDAEG